jgi:hypothetical protein
MDAGLGSMSKDYRLAALWFSQGGLKPALRRIFSAGYACFDACDRRSSLRRSQHAQTRYAVGASTKARTSPSSYCD